MPLSYHHIFATIQQHFASFAHYCHLTHLTIRYRKKLLRLFAHSAFLSRSSSPIIAVVWIRLQFMHTHISHEFIVCLHMQMHRLCRIITVTPQHTNLAHCTIILPIVLVITVITTTYCNPICTERKLQRRSLS